VLEVDCQLPQALLNLPIPEQYNCISSIQAQALILHHLRRRSWTFLSQSSTTAFLQPKH